MSLQYPAGRNMAMETPDCGGSLGPFKQIDYPNIFTMIQIHYEYLRRRACEPISQGDRPWLIAPRTLDPCRFLTEVHTHES